MFGFLVLILAGFLIWNGALPTGRFPSFSRSQVGGGDWAGSLSSILFRTAGVVIMLAILLPNGLLESWYGDIVLLILALLMIFIGLIASLPRRAL